MELTHVDLFSGIGVDTASTTVYSVVMKDYSQARSMYEGGLSIGDVAAFYGISRQAMWKILQRRGTTFRPQKKTGADNVFWRGVTAQEKRACHMVEAAIAKGILARQPCEKCGAVKTRGHHDDYNKPLEIRWLCAKHHYEWHKHNKPIPLSAPLPSMNHSEIASLGGKASAAAKRARRA